VDATRVAALAARGIRDTRACWALGAPPNDLLFCLCDLTRIGGVGALAARAFFEAGYTTVQAVAQGDAREMLARITAANESLGLYRAKLGLKDMRFCIEGAALLLRCGG
jgi:predicted flap endonuclease-1-like 5' DNA nuclease